MRQQFVERVRRAGLPVASWREEDAQSLKLLDFRVFTDLHRSQRRSKRLKSSATI
jgi:uncharacterized glyoxalase superfamily metalloenzyme YdcJ